MKHHLIRTAALSFILFLITAITIANRGQGGNWWAFIHHIPYGDKIGHIGLMGTLSFLCNLAFPRPSVKILTIPATPATLIVLTLVTLEELSQAFLPNRNCDLLDWLADLLGIALGQITALLILRSRNAPAKS